MMSDVSYRLMTLKDIDLVMQVERESFSVPWSREAFENELMINQFAKYILMEKENEVIGYCGLWLIMDEAHITNIAIVPKLRGQKLGELLMQEVISMARNAGAKTITLEVRISNLVARSLYQKLGFLEGGIRKNYYSDNQEDALVMWVELR
ncbi:ribosomal-protein-alanine N-acetyltransferase [Jeotgalibacillus proteolyticus]|uniref:[Ribosomal protein bS18]-alanine N-acetyltransferase n=2 Tax=Jeotgalibacillus proteolyticus TaxID=2082395 RepID=A0A2S5G661_9BACL|nr:ribosomal protein S18-alanine N-acetyltransferase [Jeotgalibacillus proteolyticus]PPA68455.1 ribosomal-protein-alanine N-acetyltransferase [Jeotgalibacillus proteolyticus]